MNIFHLSTYPEESARWHVDRHVVKMVLESAQLLSTAHRLLDPEPFHADLLYKSTHVNHPCSKWCRASANNYQWLYELFVCLCDEYTFRYGKIHLCDTKFRKILNTHPKGIPQIGLTPIAQAMPEQYKNENPVIAYRQYYINEKSKFAVWTKREKPYWYVKD
jgi:hypothetical protein